MTESFPHRVLVVFAHPAKQKSRLNVRLAEAARAVPGVTVHDLYEAYPDFLVDVGREQALLEAHDVIVLQHPFFWYSCPALLKEWIDLVFEFGWAYGPGGTQLEGKTMLAAITTGGGEHAYSRDGHNHFTMRELLAPFCQTADLCGMTWLPPFVVHGAIRLTDPAELAGHERDYAKLLARLREGRLDPAAVASRGRINEQPLP